MSMYLKIENPGVCPIEGFTLLGLSTARGEETKIGQFGSGAKHGVLTCLRSGIVPEIYLGTDKLEFATEDGNMAGKKYKRVLYSFQGTIERTSMTLEFGGLDWNAVEMGLREFVSNAIDSVDDVKQIKVELVNSVEPMKGQTHVYLPLTPEVNRFYSILPERFLHFTPDFDEKATILQKNDVGPSKFYYKGVFVRDSQENGLYNYNFSKSGDIDESRKLDSYAVTRIAAYKWMEANQTQLENLFRNLDKLPNTFEYSLPSYIGECMWQQNYKKNWKQAFEAVHGADAYVSETNQGPMAAIAAKKGKKLVVIPAPFFYKALVSAGVKNVIDACDGKVDRRGRIIGDAPNKLVVKVWKIWEKLEKMAMTCGKLMPNIKTFREVMNGESTTMGYYDNGTIYINEDCVTSGQTIMEELAHHITGSTDNSRDFQDFAFKLATIAMRVV